mgnify:CR=1 FL=1
MNFDSLEYFTVLARERNFTRAAEALHITQQSLSSHIAALDKEIEGLKKLTGGDGAAAEALRAAIAEMDKAIEKIESSDEYKALKLALDDDERNRQYAQAIQAKTQLEAGIEQIDSMLGKLEKGIIPGGMIEGIDEDTSLADAKDQLAEARRQAQSGFADAEQQLNDASAQLAEARREFEEKRDEALKNAGLDGVIYGAMPTGIESTIKGRVGEFLLTGVIFGSSLFTASWKDIASGLAWGLGYFGMPHIIVRFMSIEKASMVKKSATVAIIWVILSLGSVCLIAYFGRMLVAEELEQELVEMVATVELVD